MRKSLVAALVAASALVLASCAMPADDPNFDSGGEEGVIDADVASANAADQEALDDGPRGPRPPSASTRRCPPSPPRAPRSSA